MNYAMIGIMEYQPDMNVALRVLPNTSDKLKGKEIQELSVELMQQTTEIMCDETPSMLNSHLRKFDATIKHNATEQVNVALPRKWVNFLNQSLCVKNIDWLAETLWEYSLTKMGGNK